MVFNKLLKKRYYLPLFFVFMALMLFARRDYQEAKESPISLSNAHRIIGVVFTVIFCVNFILRKKVKVKLPKPLKYFGYYLAIGFLSALFYSENLLYDIWKLTELFALLTLGIYMVIISRGNLVLQASFYNFTINFIKFLLLTVLLSVIIDFDNAVIYQKFSEGALLPFRVGGSLIIINSLSVGTLASIILYLYILVYDRTQRLTKYGVFWILFSSILLIASQSRTSLIGLVVALFVYYFVLNKKNKVLKFFAFVAGTLIISLNSTYLLLLFKRGSNDEVFTSLSGRTIWWHYAWEYFQNGSILQRCFGFGFASAERIIASESSDGLMQTLDSTFVSVIISTGIIGIIVTILCFYYALKILYRKSIKDKKLNLTNLHAQIYGIVIMICIKATTTTTINMFTYYSVLFVVLSIFCQRSEYKKNNP